jgi:hypothetical protein
VQIATGGQTQRVEFLQPGTPARADTDFPVQMGAAPAAIGPSVNANQVARIVGKIGSLGGLPFQEV